ncbi:MAG: 30S ribosomal protein S3 [Candidatus Paceibacterota bacterium]|jgi:small subunit ribosomal protein S3
MSHTVHPYSHRLGIIRDWKSRWFALHGKYRENLKADILLRGYLHKRLKGMHIGGLDIERGEKTLRVVIKTARPGLLIGRSGEGSVKLRNDILTFLKGKKLPVAQEFKLDIEEIRSPEANASIVAEMIAEGLEKRMPFRRVMKQTVEKVMASREVQGIKIYLGGRLGGADMARSETLKKGRIPLQTIRADIDYGTTRASIPQGDLGIKVWIYKGEVFKKEASK